MKKISVLLVLSSLVSFLFSQNQVQCLQWKISSVQQLAKPAFADQNSVDNQPFEISALLENTQFNLKEETNNWKSYSTTEDSLIPEITKRLQLIKLAGYIATDRYTNATLSLTTNGIYEIYLDGSKVKSQKTATHNAVKTNLTLTTGKHQILIKLLSVEETLKLHSNIALKEESTAELEWSTNPLRGVNIHDILDGEYIQNAEVSPSGKYLLITEGEVLEGSGKRQNFSRIYDLTKQKQVFVLRNGSSFNAHWLPKSDKICYQVRKDQKSDLYTYDIVSGVETVIASDIDDLGRITWSPNEDYVIFTQNKQADKPGDLKRIFGNDDRLPYFRSRSFLYLLNLQDGIVQPLTTGYLSTSLHDIKPDGSRILFSTSSRDYSITPFSKQTLYEMDIHTFDLDTIWKNKLYGGNCQYSPDGKQLLVKGSPETFGELGVNVNNGHLPNSYDSQLYLYDLQSGKAEALTRDFDPSIGSVSWGQKDNIYFTASDKDLVKLFQFDLKNKTFKAYNLPVEVISRMDIAKKAPIAVFNGTSSTSPEKLFSINLNSGKYSLIAFPKEKEFSNIQFGQTESWNFINKNGTSITGQVFYPINYDPSKKYPVIVNYYGGTSPISRSFGGRYPKNTWAANGYIVYVLQPSGAFGFGQDFSALHVNGWGKDAIDDIIDGTKKFLKSHPSADADNVGCIGASYGGFTTMMLQTRTDIFKTAISHAGISDISSYWGEGYWGYSYSAGATKNSYPWNRKDIYVDNSPLFHADKFQNSILLLHGTADTNVPVGESLQFYAALKILGKNVEMVLIEGENHHILDYHKRLKWHSTIMAWFDKMLKEQPVQWNEMYPEKNL